jgi:hemolysin D
MRRFIGFSQAFMKFGEDCAPPSEEAVGSGPTTGSSFANGAARAVGVVQKRPSRSEHELAFLPAALEIVERPPPPLTGAIGGTIIALFCLTLVWASFGKVDIVATASGRIIPNGRTKVIQPFETGVVRSIHVRDGQYVAAGEALIELDSTINAAERDHLRSDLIAAELDAARLRAALKDDDKDPLASFRPPAEASPGLVSVQQQFLLNQVAEHRAKLASLDHQESQKKAELETIKASVAKLEAMLPILDQRVDIKKTLYSHETGSKANYLEILQLQIESQQDLLVQKSHGHEAEAALAAVIAQRGQTAAEYQRTLAAELVEAERKGSGLRDDLIKAEQRTKLQVLTAPEDGSVQQLAVHTIGGVVTPAQSLLVIVPADSHLEIEAMVSNRDIGFVHVGQEVEIKIDTFNFTRYGLIHGHVVSLSQDAITRDKPQDSKPSDPTGAPNSSSEPKGQELVYAARVSLERTQMQIDENLVNLTSGMAVSVEIKTGARSVISYVLSPLKRYGHESLRER